MRATFTLLFLSLVYSLAIAQPPNNDCLNATVINLGGTPTCGSSVSTNVNGSNIDATPSTPFPAFTGCDVGGQTNDVGADIWYTFTATGNSIDITMSGLSGANIVLFSGDNCSFLTPTACASGSGTVTLSASTFPNNTYYIAVYGNGASDQGGINLNLTSIADCNPCYSSENITLIANPPPVNGTYNSGQSVQFCLTVNQWNVTGTIEWLHSVVVDFGPGWDYPASFIPQPPPSCGGDGAWSWYSSPWISCNTGMPFGPGFAYDSSSGLGCGGTPGDNDPGNNWGDGVNGCANIGTGSPPVQFCWTISVTDCPPNVTGADLGIDVALYSDGDSGSWNQTGCNSGASFDILATAICCDDFDPLAIPFATSCAGVDDGYISMQGSGGFDPFATFNFTVFDQSNNIVFECMACSGTVLTDQNLAPGQYTVLATNVVTGCNRSVNVVVDEGMAPMATATADMPCPGVPAQLMGDVIPFDPFAMYTYSWTGPNGFTSFLQNPTATDAGTYTLIVSADGCPSDPVTVDVEFVMVDADASALPNPACEGSEVTLTGSGGVSYVWENVTTGEFLGAGNPIAATVLTPSTFRVTVTDANMCSETAEVFVDVVSLPFIDIDVFPAEPCEGEVIALTASGAGPGGMYFWPDFGAFINPLIFNEGDLAAGIYNISVEGTDANGCIGTGMISFEVFPTPTAQLVADNETICAGESATLTASGGVDYMWSDGTEFVDQIVVTPLVTTTYTVTVSTLQGCEDEADITITVEDPLPNPMVTCGTITPTSVEFLWDPIPNATSITVDVTTGQTTGAIVGNSYVVDQLSPGEVVTITVSAGIDGSVCEPSMTTATCTSQNCPPVDVLIDPVDVICYTGTNPTITLTASINSSGGTTVWSGTAVDPNTGIFDPVTAGIGDHVITVTYTEGACPYTDDITISIADTPDADFSLSLTNACTGEDVLTEFNGTASSQAIFNWDFDGATATPGGTVEGPHTLTWDTPGTKTVTLQIDETNCQSTVVTQTITIEEPLVAPTITCGTSTTTSVTFLWSDVAGATSYDVVITSGNGTGTLTGTSYEVTGVDPDETVTIEVTANTDNVCGPITFDGVCDADPCPAFIFDITPIDDLCSAVDTDPIDLETTVTGGDGTGTLTWSGPGVSGSTFDPQAPDAGVGSHIIIATYMEGPCVGSDSITVNIFQTPVASFTISDDPICIDTETTIEFDGTAGPTASYAWNFDGGDIVSGMDEGPYQISWPTVGTKTITLTVTENGCVSEQFSATVEVEGPLDEPVINCQSTPTSIIFSWLDIPGATGYEVNVISGPTGTLDGTTYEVTGLDAGDAVEIQVVALGDGPCGNSDNSTVCVAEDCPDVTIDIDQIADICLTPTAGAVDLTATITGGLGGGTETWSGPGVSGTTFDPQAPDAGVGTFTINLNYQEGNCGYNSTTTVTVHAVPTADFLVDPTEVCINQTTTVTYDGTGGAMATYDWDFDGGAIVSGSDSGPYQISWPTSGTKTIRLTVTENGCVSEEFTQEVEVVDPIADPAITCESTNTTIDFSWEDVPGATGYSVEVLAGASGTLNGTTYSIIDLLPGDEVTIRVIAETDNPCGSSEAEFSCIASDCLMGTWDITAIAPLCFDDEVVNIVASLDIEGNVITDDFTFSGTGANPDGTFNPATAGVGTTTVCLSYTEGVCDYQDCIDIEVLAVPTPDFTIDQLIVCEGDNVTVQYTGTADPTATYDWNFGDGTPSATDGPGPITVSWPSGGNRVISLVVTENGCVSAEAAESVQVDEELEAFMINCTPTANSTSEVSFDWPDVAGATGYTVEVTDGPTGVLNGTTYTINSLLPGQNVSIVVTAETNSICGPITAMADCQSQSCQALDVSLNGPTELCAGEDALIEVEFIGSQIGPFLVTYTVDNGPEQTITLANGETIPLDNISSTTTVQIINIVDTNLSDCVYTPNAAWAISITPPPSSGVPATALTLCEDANETISLADLLIDADLGGTWTETSSTPSTGLAFNAATGTFSTALQNAGSYTFEYAVGGNICPVQTSEVTVNLRALPTADAGLAQTLTCNMGMVTIGGSGSSTGTGISYEWSADDPMVMISDPNQELIDVSQPATYTLTVRDEFGCTATSSVVVDAEFGTPIAELGLSEISCFQANDGAIIVENVTGGRPPYSFSLNGEPFVTTNFFGSLSPGEYDLVVRDANGCFTNLAINLTEPEQVLVTLTTNIEGGDNVTEAGRPVTLTALYNPALNIDTIIWNPDSLGTGSSVEIFPTETSSFSVTIIDVNGCSDSDNINLIVEKNRPVFIPNAISPNNDGANDIFFIQGDPQVIEVIEELSIYNRWGEAVFEFLQPFPPNDPNFGWDGTHRGQQVNSAVYVYYARIRFTDGEVIDFKGDVVIVR